MLSTMEVTAAFIVWRGIQSAELAGEAGVPAKGGLAVLVTLAIALLTAFGDEPAELSTILVKMLS